MNFKEYLNDGDVLLKEDAIAELVEEIENEERNKNNADLQSREDRKQSD